MIGGKLVDLSGKIPQIKCATYSSRLILYCVSGNGGTIERIYFIPKGDVI